MASKSSKGRVLSPEVFQAELRESLIQYSLQNGERIDEITHSAMRSLVKRTRQIAPVGRRVQKRSADEGRSHFFIDIAYKKQEARWFGASSYLWYVKPPNYRLTHLLAKAHLLKDHRLSQPVFDLSGALEETMREYEEAIRRYFVE